MYNVDSTAYVESTRYNIEITVYNIESTANKVKKHCIMSKAPIKMVFDHLRQLWLSIDFTSVLYILFLARLALNNNSSALVFSEKEHDLSNEDEYIFCN